MTKRRFTDIDMAKGLAIFLVVLGHVVAREPPAGNEWYVALKWLLYKFHMPFFMFLSGAVFQATYLPLSCSRDYRQYAAKKAARLVPGFVLFSAIIWLGKAVGSRFLHVDNAQSGGIEALAQVFVQPAQSVAGSLWYVYVLLEFQLIFPLVLQVLRRNLSAVVALTAVLHIVSVSFELTPLFAIDAFCEYALFFSLGFVFIENYEAVVAFIVDRVLVFYGLFALSFLSILLWPDDRSKTIIGIFSLPALYAFVASFRASRDRAILQRLGEYTFSIYLMNTLFIGLTKGVLLKLLPWDQESFLLFFPALLGAGLVGPILLQRCALARIPYLGRITK